MTQSTWLAAPEAFADLLKTKFSPQIIIPEVAEQLGAEAAIVIQQIHYWLLKSKNTANGRVWTHNTFNQWAEQFTYWSLSKIKRIFKNLEEKGLLISYKKDKSAGNHTKWYTIDYNKLTSLLPDVAKRKKEKFLPETKADNRLVQDGSINRETNNSLTDIKKDCMSKKESIEYTNHKTKEAGNIDNQTTFSKVEEEICLRMTNAWNEIITDSEMNLTLSNTVKERLLNLWNKIFNKNEEQWNIYCVSIKSNKFLTGNKKPGFKAYSEWLVQEDTAVKILDGKYNDKSQVSQKEANKFNTQAAIETAKALTYKKIAEEEQEAQKNRLESAAEELALKKLEENWTNSDEEKAKQLFEKYMKEGREGEHKELDNFRGKFLSKGWDSFSIKLVYKDFKIKHFLNKGIDDFIEEAKKLLNLDDSKLLSGSHA